MFGPVLGQNLTSIFLCVESTLPPASVSKVMLNYNCCTVRPLVDEGPGSLFLQLSPTQPLMTTLSYAVQFENIDV